MRLHRLTILLAALLGSASPAAARNIVLTNDDGLTSNVVALYHALKADGHDVIVSVPCTNQSGMGAAAYFGRPLPLLSAGCRNGAAAVGDVGAGRMTRAGLPANDFHYVAGTPVMALLYGLDVVGQRRWNGPPDLVLSGPNEGQNVGAIILSSGTVSNAQYAAARGIPAIALSAGINSTGSETLDNPVSRVVALRVRELVAELDRNTRGLSMLPSGIALNVNLPDDPERASWRLTRIGTYNAYVVRFSENLARDATPLMLAMSKEHGISIPEQPGIALDMNMAEPTAGQVDDESVVYKSAIAVSPMRAGYDHAPKQEARLKTLLRGLLTNSNDK